MRQIATYIYRERESGGERDEKETEDEVRVC